jgi:hypothetical protein
VCKKSVQHKGIAMPKDGKPINISEGITIYTMKATPDFEVKINGKTSTVSYKSKRTIEEAWGVAVDLDLTAHQRTLRHSDFAAGAPEHLAALGPDGEPAQLSALGFRSAPAHLAALGTFKQVAS